MQKPEWSKVESYPFPMIIRQTTWHTGYYYFNRSITEVALEKVPGIHREEYCALIS
jgi:hypothetical protein